MNKSNDLLNLEKKLENNSSQDLILNRFKFNKPNISQSNLDSNLFNNVSSFLEKFKASNDDLINNPDKLQQASIEAHIDNKYKNKYIEMNLGLGVLDIKPKEDVYDSVMNDLNGVNEQNLEMGNEELLKFIMDNQKKPKKRIHKIKK